MKVATNVRRACVRITGKVFSVKGQRSQRSWAERMLQWRARAPRRCDVAAFLFLKGIYDGCLITQ